VVDSSAKSVEEISALILQTKKQRARAAARAATAAAAEAHDRGDSPA